MAYRWLHRRWPVGKRVWWPLLAAELAVLVPCLVLFGVQQPDMFRSKFWRIGYENGFNSNPNIVIFAMVNNEPLPTVPFVWSSTLTNFNVAISVVNLFILLVRMITLIMKVCYPLVALFVNIGLVAIWAASLGGQAGPDYADPERPSPVPWYLSKGCKYARPWGMTNTCYMVKGTVAITVVMLFLMVIHLGISIWAMMPNQRNGQGWYDDEEDEDADNGNSSAAEAKHEAVEMHNIPPASQPIFTPRTQAFNTLDGQIPRQA